MALKPGIDFRSWISVFKTLLLYGVGRLEEDELKINKTFITIFEGSTERTDPLCIFFL